jgi:hypothetical protein
MSNKKRKALAEACDLSTQLIGYVVDPPENEGEEDTVTPIGHFSQVLVPRPDEPIPDPFIVRCPKAVCFFNDRVLDDRRERGLADQRYGFPIPVHLESIEPLTPAAYEEIQNELIDKFLTGIEWTINEIETKAAKRTEFYAVVAAKTVSIKTIKRINRVLLKKDLLWQIRRITQPRQSINPHQTVTQEREESSPTSQGLPVHLLFVFERYGLSNMALDAQDSASDEPMAFTMEYQGVFSTGSFDLLEAIKKGDYVLDATTAQGFHRSVHEGTLQEGDVVAPEDAPAVKIIRITMSEVIAEPIPQWKTTFAKSDVDMLTDGRVLGDDIYVESLMPDSTNQWISFHRKEGETP